MNKNFAQGCLTKGAINPLQHDAGCAAPFGEQPNCTTDVIAKAVTHLQSASVTVAFVSFAISNTGQFKKSYSMSGSSVQIDFDIPIFESFLLDFVAMTSLAAEADATTESFGESLYVTPPKIIFCGVCRLYHSLQLFFMKSFVNPFVKSKSVIDALE